MAECSFIKHNINWINKLLWFSFSLSTDASSSNEAVHLQQRLKSLSSELVTLRNRLHVGQTTGDVTTADGSPPGINLVASTQTTNLSNGPFTTNSNMQTTGSSIIPIPNSNNKINSKVEFYDLVLISGYMHRCNPDCTVFDVKFDTKKKNKKRNQFQLMIMIANLNTN